MAFGGKKQIQYHSAVIFVLDLIAYIRSAGDPNDQAFK